MTKKINPTHSENWEYDFSDLVPCDHCSAMGSLLEMTEVRKQTNTEPINLRFCGEDCASAWYLAYLRRHET